MARRFGYSRVSTSDQDWSLQLEALTKAGVDDRDIFREKASGAKRDRTELRRMLDLLRPGDQVVVYTWTRNACTSGLSEILLPLKGLDRCDLVRRIIRSAMGDKGHTSCIAPHGLNVSGRIVGHGQGQHRLRRAEHGSRPVRGGHVGLHHGSCARYLLETAGKTACYSA